MVATATGVVVCQLHFTGLPTLLVSCDSAIVLLLYCASSLLCCFSIVLLCYCASSLLCFFSIVLLCYCASSLLCIFAIVIFAIVLLLLLLHLHLRLRLLLFLLLLLLLLVGYTTNTHLRSLASRRKTKSQPPLASGSRLAYRRSISIAARDLQPTNP